MLDRGSQRPSEPRRNAMSRAFGAAVSPIGRMWGSSDPLDAYGLVQMASVAGDALLAIALADSVFFSVPVGQARAKVVLYLALTLAPLAACAPLLAPLLDHGGYRRAISFFASGGRAAAAAYGAGVVDSALLFPVVFVALVLSRVHGITRNGLVGAYATSERGLIAANARLGRLGAVAAFVISVPGLIILKIGGSGAAMWFAAGMYGLAAALVFRLARPQQRAAPVTDTTGTDPGERTDPFGRLPSLGGPALGVAGLRAAQGFLLFLFAFALRSAGEPAWWLGVVVVCGLVGGVAGDVIAPKLRERVREEGVVLFSLVAGAVAGGIAVAGAGASLLGLAVLSAVTGVATETGKLAFQSLMQSRAPAGRHGRVFVRYEVLFQLAWVGGALIPSAIPLGLRAGTILLTMAYLALAIIYTARLVRERSSRSSPPSPGPPGSPS